MNPPGRLKRAYVLPVGIFIALFSIVGLYFALENTVIADLRESTMTIDTGDPYAHGEILFQTRGCAACHAFDAAGSDGDTGPVLTGIASRHDTAYIRESILNPNAVIADDCPEEACEPNIMPQFGQILDDTQIDALVTYLTAQE